MIPTLIRKYWLRQPIKSEGELDPNLRKTHKIMTGAIEGHRLPPRILRLSYRLLTRLFNQPAPPMKVTCIKNGNFKLYQYGDIDSSKPTMMYMHGGGFVIGSHKTHDTLCKLIKRNSGYNVISVDYRLAPEYPYPTPINDCIDAYNWLILNSNSLGFDANKLGVGGDSAGATAAMVIHLAADHESQSIHTSHQRPAFRWLMYPLSTMDEKYLYKSEEREDSFLPLELMEYFHRHYMKQAKREKHWSAAPMYGNWHNMDKTLVITVKHDPLTAGTLAWLDTLSDQNNLDHFHFPHLYHEFISMTGVSPNAKESLDKSIDWLTTLFPQD